MQNRCLVGFARQLPNHPRYQITRQTQTQLFQQRLCLLQRYREMRGTGHRVEEVQVIRHHPDPEQDIAQFRKGIGIIIG